MDSFAPYLELAIKAARAAGDLLRADFHRPLGPRGEYDKAPADTEAEQVIRGILLGGVGDWGFLGEETGSVPGTPGAPIWVVDPNDGTRDYIKGRRGSSVSIAVVWNRRPVLGVVHPFGYPDDAGSIYAAAVGREGVFKNGAPVAARLPDRLCESDVVLVSGGGDRAARANLECTQPARVMCIPSIAHRLAKVAAGEAAATTSLYSPKTWDFAAGHCLILAAGGAVLDQHGQPPTYDDAAEGWAPRLFAGSESVARELSARPWDKAFQSQRETEMPIARLRKGGGVQDAAFLSRAQGALVGQLVGSALGSLFASDPAATDAASIESASQVRRLPAGQIGSSGEIAVAAARSILANASDHKSLRKAYAAWVASSPLLPDRAMEAGAAGQPSADPSSALAFARVTPLTLWGQAADPSVLAVKVAEDVALTHKWPLAAEAAATLAIVLHSLLHGTSPEDAIQSAHSFARKSGWSREVIDAITGSAEPPPRRAGAMPIDAVSGLRAALFHLGRAASFETALEAALAMGSGDDALPAMVGALLGARFGRDGIPERLRNLVLSCRPMEGLAAHPRPSSYWATDALALAEAPLTVR